MHRLGPQPRENEVDHHRRRQQLAARDRHLVDRHVFRIALALRLQEPDAERTAPEGRRHAVHQLGGDVLPGLRDPVGLRQIAHVAPQNFPALGRRDARQIGAHPKHRLAAETWHVLRNAPVADHPPHDAPGRIQQAIQLADASLEVIVEPRQIVLDGLQTVLDEARRLARVVRRNQGVALVQMRSHLRFALDPPEAFGVRKLPDLLIARVDPVTRLVPPVLRPPETGNGRADELRDLFVARELDVVGRRGIVTHDAAEGVDPTVAGLRQTLVPCGLPACTVGGAGLVLLDSLLLLDGLFRRPHDPVNLLRVDTPQVQERLRLDLPGPLFFLRTVLPVGVLRAAESFRRPRPRRMDRRFGNIRGLPQAVAGSLGLEFDASEVAELRGKPLLVPGHHPVDLDLLAAQTIDPFSLQHRQILQALLVVTPQRIQIVTCPTPGRRIRDRPCLAFHVRRPAARFHRLSFPSAGLLRAGIPLRRRLPR